MDFRFLMSPCLFGKECLNVLWALLPESDAYDFLVLMLQMFLLHVLLTSNSIPVYFFLVIQLGSKLLEL